MKNTLILTLTLAGLSAHPASAGPRLHRSLRTAIIVSCESAATAAPDCLNPAREAFAVGALSELIDASVSHSVDAEMLRAKLLLAGRELERRVQTARGPAETAAVYRDWIIHSIVIVTAGSIELDDPNRGLIMRTLRVISEGPYEHGTYERARAVLRERD